MNRPVKSRIISSREESEAEQRALRLQAQGAAAFGDPNVPFSIEDEMQSFPSVQESVARPAPQSKPKTQPVQNRVQPKKEVKQMEEEVQEVEQNEDGKEVLSDDPMTRMEQVSNIFSKTVPGFPSGQTLMNWKGIYGSVFILEAAENVFIYRYLKRQEWIQMNQDPAFLKQRVDQREDTLFNKCVLWPKLPPEKIAALPAGAVSSIVAQIEQQSLFVDPRELANLTIKL